LIFAASVINTIPADGDLSVVAARMPAGGILSEGARGHWPLSLAGPNREVAEARSPSGGSTPLRSENNRNAGTPLYAHRASAKADDRSSSYGVE